MVAALATRSGPAHGLAITLRPDSAHRGVRGLARAGLSLEALIAAGDDPAQAAAEASTVRTAATMRFLVRPGAFLMWYPGLLSEYPACKTPWVTHDGAQTIEVSLDLTPQWHELGAGLDARSTAMVTWTLDHTPIKPDPTRPGKVARFDCLS
jgi:hypothetical protein